MMKKPLEFLLKNLPEKVEVTAKDGRKRVFYRIDTKKLRRVRRDEALEREHIQSSGFDDCW